MFEKKNGKRFLASVMALVMLLSLAPVGALAAENEPLTTEECSGVALPANEADPKPVVTDEENTANTNEEPTSPPPNKGDTIILTDNNNTSTAISEAVILLEGDLFDQPFGVNPPESSEPSTQYERLYVTILNGTEFPNEPGFSHNGYDFVKQSGNGGYSIEAYSQASYSSNQQVFSTQAGNFIKVNAFDAAGLTTNGNVRGLYNANGIDLNRYTNFTENDANAIAAAYASYKRLDTNATYKLVPYVLKYEDHGTGSDAPSTGYHLDCIVVKNETVLVKYDMNGATTNGATTAFQLPDNTYVVPGSNVTIGSWKNSSGTTVADNSITAQKNGKDVTFVGWSTNPNADADSQGLYQAGSELQNVTGETTLYAIWKVKEDTSQPDPAPGSPTLVTAKFFINLGGMDASNREGTGDFTDEIIINDALNYTLFEQMRSKDMTSNNGYIFARNGVKTVAGCEGNNLLREEPTNVQINSALSVKNRNDLSVGGEGNRYVVWYHVSDCTNMPGNQGYHVDGYIANRPITITYDPNGGVFSSEVTTDSFGKHTINDCKSGATHEIIDATPTRDGYEFAGWKLGDEDKIYQSTDSITPTGDVTLVAQWEKKVTLTYHENFGKTEHTYTISVDKDSKQTVQSYAELRRLYGVFGENKGFYFDKWNTQKDGKGTSYKKGNTISMTGSIDLYAQWKQARVPKVAYTINQHFMDGEGKPSVANPDITTNKTTKNAQTTLDSLITDDLKKSKTGTDGKTYVYVPSETKFTLNDKAVTALVDGTEIHLYYYLDEVGGTPEKEGADRPDGIPDAWQHKVTFQVVNGNWNVSKNNKNIVVYVNAKNQAGEVLDSKLTASQIPAVGSEPNSGYEASGSWDKTLSDGLVINADTTFTFTYSKRSSSGGSSRPSTPPTVDIPDDVPTGLNGKDHYAYIIGYGNNDVRPQNNITRAEVATIFFRLLTDETREANMTKSNGYNDVKDGDWFCCAVSTLSKMGIIKGYEDGSFKPNDPISRAEFAAIAARFDPDGDKTPASFSDVTSHWAKDEISIAANHGWIKGYEDGSFKPDQKITRAETMTLVNRVLNRLPEAKDDLHKDMKTWVDNMDETAWYYLAVQEATNSHYFKNKTGTKFEQWTDLRDTRDWSELEK